MPKLAAQRFDEKYQPQTIAEFVGLKQPKRMMSAFVARPYVSSWLCVGPAGTGKTAMSFAVATALGVNKDIGGGLHHIPARACNPERLDQVIESCYYAPMSGSPCTGKPCNNQSRCSAWLILKWLQELYVEAVLIEN